MSAAYNYYLRLDGVIGEVTAPGFVGWIEVFSSAEGTSSASQSLGTRSTSQTAAHSMTFAIPLQNASARLNSFCAQGHNIQTAEFNIVKGGQSVIRMQFEDVVIMTYSTSGNAGGTMVDQFTIDFRKRTYRYMREPVAAHVKQGWALSINTRQP